MRMVRNFRQTQLQKAVIAASYAASFESELPQDVSNALGAGYAADGNATTQFMLDYLEAVNEYSGGSKNLHIDGAAIPILPPGTKLNLQNPGASAPDHEQYEASLLRYVASALDLSYEQFSRDFTKTNYSSARASIGEMWKAMQSRKRRVADRTANFIYRLWLEEAINRNEIECLKRRNVPSFYDGMNGEFYCQCEWIGAGRGMIDPLKETQADVLALKAGITTKEAVIARRDGGDWRRTARQIRREIQVDDEYGNPSVYGQDATDQTNALSGTPQERQQ
jgi:lambda family phage portal protein